MWKKKGERGYNLWIQITRLWKEHVIFCIQRRSHDVGERKRERESKVGKRARRKLVVRQLESGKRISDADCNLNLAIEPWSWFRRERERRRERGEREKEREKEGGRERKKEGEDERKRVNEGKETTWSWLRWVVSSLNPFLLPSQITSRMFLLVLFFPPSRNRERRKREKKRIDRL